MNSNKNDRSIIMKIILFLIVVFFIDACFDSIDEKNVVKINKKDNVLYILSSYDYSPMENDLKKALKKKAKIDITYMSDIDIVDELNENSDRYDAVWISNSMWLYQLKNSYLTSNSKSLGISPVVFGVSYKKAKSLGLIGRDVTTKEILSLINEKKIKYVMPSVTRTNSGATAYLGFLSSLLGNPEVITENMLNDKKLATDLITLFSGVERVSGDESYMEEMFLNGDSYDSLIASESSIISINNKLKKAGKDQLYLLYPTDGVAVNDSTLAFLGVEGKEELFMNVQSYLLSEEGQKLLSSYGYRTWYGGINPNADKKVFNPDLGIDTTKYLNVTKFPSKDIITTSLNLFIEKFRKPTHVVFCLDYSGSMYGTGIADLRSAMDYILDYEKSSADKLQFSEFDKITILPFSTRVESEWSTDNGKKTATLIENINRMDPNGATALYDAIEKGLDILRDESSDYTTTIIAMTDGAANIGTFKELKKYYNSNNLNIPVYSITFGDSDERQLKEIAELTNAKVFDGKTDLLKAFKEVRGYN